MHINDPDFFDELYVHTKKLDKYKWWTNLAGSDGSSFATVSHELHRRRRGALNPFFSVRSVTELEPLVRSKIDKLCRRFEDLAQSNDVFRLDVAFMALTMDIISDYSFAMDPKYLEEPDFHLEWKTTIINAMESGALARQFPWMASVMGALPLSVVSVLHPPMANLLIWRNGVAERVRPILAGTDELSLSEKNKTSRTIFHALRDSDLPPEEKTLGRLCDEGQILTGAGSETTAQTLTRLFFYLRQKSDVLRKLRSELDEAVPGEVPPWVELQQFPYLVSSNLNCKCCPAN